MRNFTIILVAYNEKDYVKLAIQSIRMFADVDNLSVVLVDNGSTDGLYDWAITQTDITCVYMDEGNVPFGQAINLVTEQLEITGDIMIMNGHFLLTQGCLSHMQDALYEAIEIGAVGPMSNGFLNDQKAIGIDNYEEASRGLFYLYGSRLAR